MKFQFACISLLVLTSACDRDDAAIAALHHDVVKLTLDIATVQAKLEDSEKQTAALRMELGKVLERVRQLEVEKLTRAPQAGAMPSSASTSSTSQVADPHRGGFTDLGSAGASLPPLSSHSQSLSSPAAQVSASSDDSETWNAVAKAGDFYDAPRVIASKCQREWPSDQRMLQYCVEKQTQAVSQLKRGRPFGADERQWNTSRVRCANKWPDDYSMRVYCEQHP